MKFMLIDDCRKMPSDNSKILENRPFFQFQKVKCIICFIEYWECPECWKLMLQVAEHDCCNSWLENLLHLSCRNPPVGNLLSRSEYEHSFCCHVFRETN